MQKIANKATIRMSCGGGEHELYVDSYGGGYVASHTKKFLCDEKFGADAQDPDGNSLIDPETGKLNAGCARLDGGLADPCTGSTGCKRGHQIPEGKKYDGKYRMNQSGSSNTCCPPLGFDFAKLKGNLWKSNGTYTSNSRFDRDLNTTIGRWLFNHEPNQFKTVTDVCYGDMYGSTRHCESDFDLEVYECSGCDCKHKTLPEMTTLIEVHTRHTLLSDNKGCRPWFTLVDAGMRTLVGKLRAEAASQKLTMCQDTLR